MEENKVLTPEEAISRFASKNQDFIAQLPKSKKHTFIPILLISAIILIAILILNDYYNFFNF